jgi:hypothetical protein
VKSEALRVRRCDDRRGLHAAGERAPIMGDVEQHAQLRIASVFLSNGAVEPMAPGHRRIVLRTMGSARRRELWVGGQFDTVSGVPQNFLARFTNF